MKELQLHESRGATSVIVPMVFCLIRSSSTDSVCGIVRGRFGNYRGWPCALNITGLTNEAPRGRYLKVDRHTLLCPDYPNVFSRADCFSGVACTAQFFTAGLAAAAASTASATLRGYAMGSLSMTSYVA